MEFDISILLAIASLATLLGAVILTTVNNHHAEVNRKLNRIMDHLGIQHADGDMAQVGELARAGKTVQAVKLHRQLTGSSLKEAKDAVDELAG